MGIDETVSPEQAVNSKVLNEEVCEASKTRACAMDLDLAYRGWFI